VRVLRGPFALHDRDRTRVLAAQIGKLLRTSSRDLTVAELATQPQSDSGELDHRDEAYDHQLLPTTA
jgi:hypothetical protein